MTIALQINRLLALVIVMFGMVGMAWPISVACAQPVEISREQVNEFCKRLRFDEDQLAVAQELYDAHVTGRQEIYEVTKARRAEHRAKFPERSKRSAVKGFAIEVQYEEAKEELNNALLDDLHLLQLPSETALGDWELAMRSHQVYTARHNCELGRGRFDVSALVARFRAEDAPRLALEIEAYEREMLVQARRQKTLDHQITVAFPRTYGDNGRSTEHKYDSDFSKLRLRLADTSVALGEIQWKYALRFERCLIESDRSRFRRELYALTDRELEVSDMEKQLRHAPIDESLSPQTRDAVLKLSREFVKRSAKPLASVSETSWQHTNLGIRRAFEPDQEKWSEQRAILYAELEESWRTWEELQAEFAAKLEAVLARQQPADGPPSWSL